MIKNAWTNWITLKRSDATWCNSDVDWLAWPKFLGENRAELGNPESHVSCLPEAMKSSSVGPGKLKKITSSRLTNLVINLAYSSLLCPFRMTAVSEGSTRSRGVFFSPRTRLASHWTLRKMGLQLVGALQVHCSFVDFCLVRCAWLYRYIWNLV